MKFIHTSDWHLGRQLHGHSLLTDQAHVLNQLVELAQAHRVAAVVIAGDIYDRSIPPSTAVALLDQVVHRLCDELGVKVILIPGNHDGAQRLAFGARQLQQSGLHIIADFEQMCTPVTLREGDLDVNFYGIPYNDPETVRNHFNVPVTSHDEAHELLLDKIADSGQGQGPSVLISHCFIDGAQTSDSERPLSIGGADRVSYQPFLAFDYVALGHLHSPQYKGAEHIRYSGSILKYSVSETRQKKGVTLVEIGPQGLVGHQFLPLSPRRDLRIIEGQLADILDQAKTDPNSNDYIWVRLTDQHALLDPMHKLREVYPNILHMEKSGFLAAGGGSRSARVLARDEMSMFADFYTEVTGTPLSEAQQEAMQALLADLNKQGDEL